METPIKTQQRVIAFCKYGTTVQQAAANVAAAINAYLEGKSPQLIVETMSHTVSQLAEPVPPELIGGDPDPEYVVVTALVTFATVQ